MEEQLDDVAGGEREWVPVVRDFWVPFSAKITEGRENIAKQVEVTDIPCPLTGDKGDMLIKRFGRNGWFLGCAATPSASTPSRSPARSRRRSRDAGRGGGVPAVRAGPPGRQARPLRSVRRLRPLPGVQATSRRTRRRPASSSAPARSAARGRSSPSAPGAAGGRSGAATAIPIATTPAGPGRSPLPPAPPHRTAPGGCPPASRRGRPGARQRRRGAWLTAARRPTPPARCERFLSHLEARNASPGTRRRVPTSCHRVPQLPRRVAAPTGGARPRHGARLPGLAGRPRSLAASTVGGQPGGHSLLLPPRRAPGLDRGRPDGRRPLAPAARPAAARAERWTMRRGWSRRRRRRRCRQTPPRDRPGAGGRPGAPRRRAARAPVRHRHADQRGRLAHHRPRRRRRAGGCG